MRKLSHVLMARLPASLGVWWSSAGKDILRSSARESRAFLYWYMFVQLKRSPDLWKGGGECHNARVSTVLQSDPEVSRTLDAKGLCLFSAPDDSPLIVGSQVVLRAGVGRLSCLEDPDQGLAFPLAKDVLLGFIHGSARREHEVLSASEVDSVNRATAGHCGQIGGPNKQVVLRSAGGGRRTGS